MFEKKANTIFFANSMEGNKTLDLETFELVFHHFYPRLVAFAIRFVADENEAKDIVQECFVNFWEKRSEFSSDAVSSLLFTMVRNACLNWLKHRAVVENYQTDYIEKSRGEEQLYNVDFLMNADKTLLYEELKEEINRVLNSLPERCRLVFRMSRFEGLKNREIAERLNISSTAVEKHISKALSRFSIYFRNNNPNYIYFFIVSTLFFQS